jgi:hypothetical protein
MSSSTAARPAQGTPEPATGTAFNPRRRFHIAAVPLPLQQSNLVSQGAKLCYAQLQYHLSDAGLCYPSEETLARELGRSRRQIIRYLNELREARLVRSQRHRDGPATWEFLWHPVFSASKSLKSLDVTSMAHPDVTHMAHRDVTEVAHAFKEEENTYREHKRTIDRPLDESPVEPTPPRKRCRPGHWQQHPAEDLELVHRAVGRLRDNHGLPLLPTESLILRLLQIAAQQLRTARDVADVLEAQADNLHDARTLARALTRAWKPRKPAAPAPDPMQHLRQQLPAVVNGTTGGAAAAVGPALTPRLAELSQRLWSIARNVPHLHDLHPKQHADIIRTIGELPNADAAADAFAVYIDHGPRLEKYEHCGGLQYAARTFAARWIEGQSERDARDESAQRAVELQHQAHIANVRAALQDPVRCAGMRQDLEEIAAHCGRSMEDMYPELVDLLA